MSRLLAGKTFVITGASSGIGRACAIACADGGADLILMGRNEERLLESLSLLDNTVGNHMVLKSDLSEPDTLEADVKKILKERRVNGLLACAGIREVVPLRACTPETYHHAFSINVVGTLELVRIVSSRQIMAQEGGSIVLLSSIVTSSGGTGLMAYSASKAALEGAMKVAAGELAPRNIRVNCLVPGHVQNTGMWTQMSTETPQHIEHLGDRYPLGLGLPSDIANAALFLLSDGARWITGTSVLVDGGYSLRS